jgi:SOS-response transcriptional repressor LexA
MRPPEDPVAADRPLRLSPEMASFRGLVLQFVASYIKSWGQSPSYGEIAAATNSNRTRVKRAITSLERAGLLLRRKGTRGLSLPDQVEQARRTLERAGMPLPQDNRVTKATLLPPPALDYPSAARRSARGQDRDGNTDDRR